MVDFTYLFVPTTSFSLCGNSLCLFFAGLFKSWVEARVRVRTDRTGRSPSTLYCVHQPCPMLPAQSRVSVICTCIRLSVSDTVYRIGGAAIRYRYSVVVVSLPRP